MKQALSGSPETKSITFPMWRDERKHFVSLDYLLGAFAMWAVRQSPYHCPDNLEEAICELRGLVQPKWKGAHFAELSCDEIRGLLKGEFEASHWIMEWNKPKSGHGRPVSCTRRDGPKPDDDFIDLYALARNISHTIILEALYDEDQSTTKKESKP